MENALLLVWHQHLLELGGTLSKEKNPKPLVICVSNIKITGSLEELSHCELRLNASLHIFLVIQL